MTDLTREAILLMKKQAEDKAKGDQKSEVKKPTTKVKTDAKAKSKAAK